MPCCFQNSRVVMSLDLVLSYCNNECLSMCTLSGFVCHSVMEVSLCMITKFLNKPLQMTTLVNLAFPPKGVGKPSTSRGITRCCMDLLGPTTSVGTRTDYSVGPWDYSACATRHPMAWSTRTTKEKYSVRKLYVSRTVWKTRKHTRLVLSPYSDL
jgi:hypothetical protein